jgi:hypothetical protein
VNAKDRPDHATDPSIEIKRTNQGVNPGTSFTSGGTAQLKEAMVDLNVPARFVTSRDSPRYILEYEGEDQWDCDTYNVLPLPGVPGIGGLGCADGYQVGITKASLRDANTQQVIWSYDVPRKHSDRARNADLAVARELRKFLKKQKR